MKVSGNEISYGFADCVFGQCFLAWFDGKICQLSFFDSAEYETAIFKEKYAGNKITQNNERASEMANRIFNKHERLPMQLEGTEFQMRVWEALSEIPVNTTTTYADIADKVGKPKAVRAVGSAVGANPIAFMIPCHRVIRTDGELGGYRWGLDIKKKMLAFEKTIGA